MIIPQTQLLINDVPVQCINQAARDYHIPASLIISVLKTENGRGGMASRNKNGTYDYGPMQINTIWIKRLNRYGVTRQDVQYNSCVNVLAGSWILGQALAESHMMWRGVGDYHSHNLRFNQQYRQVVARHYRQINSAVHR